MIKRQRGREKPPEVSSRIADFVTSLCIIDVWNLFFCIVYVGCVSTLFVLVVNNKNLFHGCVALVSYRFSMCTINNPEYLIIAYTEIHIITLSLTFFFKKKGVNFSLIKWRWWKDNRRRRIRKKKVFPYLTSYWCRCLVFFSLEVGHSGFGIHFECM